MSTAAKVPKLTPRERELLRVIEDNRRLMMPPVRLLCELMGVSSPGTISHLLKRLRAKGYLAE